MPSINFISYKKSLFCIRMKGLIRPLGRVGGDQPNTGAVGLIRMMPRSLRGILLPLAALQCGIYAAAAAAMKCFCIA